LAEAAALDAAEDAAPPVDGQRVPAGLIDPGKRRRQLQATKEQLEAAKDRLEVSGSALARRKVACLSVPGPRKG
jgi:gamma-glutamylcysteine synthetase